ncbi:MAG: GNAT family protein [Elusimicrobiota bacterium]|nr:GNAT family protein [Elusimicrobiota bacterium]
MTTLSTRRLLLRPVVLADAPRFAACSRDPRVAVPVGIAAPWTLAQARARVREARALMRGRRLLAVSLFLRGDGRWVGSLNLRWPHPGVGELGYYLLPEHWGRGYATEVVRFVVDLAFREHGAHRVQATAWVRNPASARVLLKAGLRKEGRLRGYLKRGDEVRDEFVFGVTRGDWRKTRASVTLRAR